MSAMASEITGVRLFAQPFIQAHIKEISKLRVTALWGESPGNRRIPLPKDQ